MNIPVIQIGLASFGVAVTYQTDTKQFCYLLSALKWSKAGVLYRG